MTLKHGTVEFLTTLRYIEKYIRPENLVIEIGAGTGRYSHALARQGYTVDAVELISHNIDIFHKNTMSNEDITIMQGNALDLSVFPDNRYDITLLLGSLYHLYSDEDKRRIVRGKIWQESQAMRLTYSKNNIDIWVCSFNYVTSMNRMLFMKRSR